MVDVNRHFPMRTELSSYMMSRTVAIKVAKVEKQPRRITSGLFGSRCYTAKSK